MSDDDNITVFPAPKKRPAGPGRGHKIKQGNGFVNKPASGLPAMGAGWGGDASGTEGWKKGEVHAKKPPGTNEGRAEEMRNLIYDIAIDSENPAGLRMMAADKLLDRIEGKPVQRVLGGTAETVEEIRTKDPIEAARAYDRIISGKP